MKQNENELNFEVYVSGIDSLMQKAWNKHKRSFCWSEVHKADDFKPIGGPFEGLTAQQSEDLWNYLRCDDPEQWFIVTDIPAEKLGVSDAVVQIIKAKQGT